jgi:integrase/recombinase XerD
MKPKQIMLFYKYIHEVRSKVIKENTSQLILNLRGGRMTADSINYLVETFKPLFPDRNLNAKTIRQSVITNLLKQKKDLRIVQVFAGHKKPSSTERYRQTGLEELKAAVMKYHPLG